MVEMNEAIKEAIQKNLPSAVAEELKCYIKEAQKSTEVLALTKSQLEDARQKLKTAEQTLAIHADLDKRRKELDEREKTIEHEKLNVIREKAGTDAHIANASLRAAMEVIGIVFKNPELRTTFVKQSTQSQTPDHTNNYQAFSTRTETDTKTTVQD